MGDSGAGEAGEACALAPAMADPQPSNRARATAKVRARLRATECSTVPFTVFLKVLFTANVLASVRMEVLIWLVL